MSYHVHQIDGIAHREFLDEQRVDPVMRQQFRAGDKVVFCAGRCRSAFLEDSWVDFLDEEHCGQFGTLDAIPPPRSNRGFLGWKRGSRNGNASTGTRPAGARGTRPIRTPIAPPRNSGPSPIRAFSASAFSIRPGQSVTLNWDVEPKYDVSINRRIGGVTNTGARSVIPRAWFWGWPFLLNRRRTSYVLSARGPNGIFKQKLKIELALPVSPVAISRTIHLETHSVVLPGISPLRQLNAPLRRTAVLLKHKLLRTFLRLKQNQIKLCDYVALIMPPEIIRNLSSMPFYQRIPIGFFRRFKRWANMA